MCTDRTSGEGRKTGNRKKGLYAFKIGGIEEEDALSSDGVLAATGLSEVLPELWVTDGPVRVVKCGKWEIERGRPLLFKFGGIEEGNALIAMVV